MSLYRGPRRPLAGRRNEALAINWRRGLFRVWVLVSVAWVLGWAIYMVIDAIREGPKNTRDLLVIPVVLIGPPMALLVFGFAAGWAFRGFRSEGEASDDGQPGV